MKQTGVISSKNNCNASILKCTYDISRFSFFRFSTNPFKPSGYSQIKFGDIYSPILCPRFLMIPFENNFLILISVEFLFSLVVQFQIAIFWWFNFIPKIASKTSLSSLTFCNCWI